ncbi:MAG: phosphoribosyltransferase [Prochlorococcus sp.]
MTEANRGHGLQPLVETTGGELIISWHQYHGLIEHLAWQLHQGGCRFDQIVALSRGGLRVGDVLSRIFDKPLVVMAAQSYSGSNGREQGELRLGNQLAHTCESLGPDLLLVDDLADSGATLLAAQQWLEQNFTACKIHKAVLWLKGCSRIKPDVWAMELPANPWIVQPFEQWQEKQPAELRPLRKNILN